METRVMKTYHCKVILNTLSNAVACPHTIFQQNEDKLLWISAINWSEFDLNNFIEMRKELKSPQDS